MFETAPLHQDFEATQSGRRTKGVTQIEHTLQEALVSGDRALRSVPSMLSLIVGESAQSLLSDAIVAKVRGFLESLAEQLLEAKAGCHRLDIGSREIDKIVAALSVDGALLNYCYALAVESRATDKLGQTAAVDPVLSPLLQELIASSDAASAELAMRAMAAQSRFVQQQMRMELPLEELPAELLDRTLNRWRSIYDEDAEIIQAVESIKNAYDEGSSRTGLMMRLVTRMRGGAIAGLEVAHAGMALFTTSLASLSKQPRELTVLACQEGQAPRLALSLRSTGMESEAIQRQFHFLNPAEQPSSALRALDPARALAILHHDHPAF